MGSNATKTVQLQAATPVDASPTDKPKACKACCACPETKQVRDAW